MDKACAWRERIRKTFRPLDQQNAILAQIVIPADVAQFGFSFEAVEVKVEHRQAAAWILVDERKSWAGNVFCITAKAAHDAFCEVRLARPQVAAQGQDFAAAQIRRQRSADMQRLLRTVGNDRIHGF